MTKRLFAIRGAVQTENIRDSILNDVGLLMKTIFEKNGIKDPKDIVSIQFTMTGDLDEMNAATALRRYDTGLDTSSIPLFCGMEASVKGMMPRVVRVMITLYMDENSKIIPVYMNGAEKLRPDFKAV